MPIVGLVGAGIGLYQGISGAVKAHKNEEALQNQVNQFQPNQSILDYYNKALARYSPNPYESTQYQQQNNQIQRNLATGINAANNKRQGLGALGGLVQQANDASAKAAGSADQAQKGELQQLGQAANAKTAEQQKKFDMQYNLTAMKAGAGASMENSGISNLYGGLSNAAYLYGNTGLNSRSGSTSYNNAWDKKFGDIFY
jgi:hypothetical protein